MAVMCLYRHWLVVKEDGHMVTGRQQPRLVLVALTSDGGRLCLNGPDMEELQMALQQPHNPIMDCRWINCFGTAQH